LDGVFVDSLVVQSADPAPTIVIDKTHRRFPPCAFPENPPLQNGCHDVMSILENVGFSGEIFANDSLYRIITAVE
jgi:hypothetical protein